jgi:hypothetical protein
LHLDLLHLQRTEHYGTFNNTPATMNQDNSGSRADSLLVFGSLALSFDASSFRQLQKAVAESVDVHWLADLISTLPEELEHVLVTFPTTQPLATKARKHLQDLHDAFSTGCPLESAFPLSNILLIPLVVIYQLTQYAAFVRSTSVEPDSRVDIFASAKSRRETIGLCTGSLSAFAVSSARNDSEFRQYGSTAVRLGMLIGLVIDAQEETRSLSVTWLPTSTKEELQRIVSQTEKVPSRFCTRKLLPGTAAFQANFLEGIHISPLR